MRFVLRVRGVNVLNYEVDTPEKAVITAIQLLSKRKNTVNEINLGVTNPLIDETGEIIAELVKHGENCYHWRYNPRYKRDTFYWWNANLTNVYR